MICLNLDNENAYKWFRYNDVYIKGYIVNRTFENVAAIISDTNNIGEIASFINSLCGCFAIVKKNRNMVFSFVDRLRSIPLFYYKNKNNGDLIICDSLDKSLSDIFGINEENLIQFKHSLYTYSKYTLLDEVYQIPASSYLVADNEGSNVEIKSYWQFEYSKDQIKSIDLAVNEIVETYNNVFVDYTRYIKNRNVVIPLSGGHDSRLILNYLKKYGCKNIITYSYGSEKWSDASISKSVANAYGVPHYFITYGKKEHSEYLQIINEIEDYSANFTSVPAIQEIIAIKHLKENGVIKSDSVIVPGYGGVITGHYVREKYLSGEKFSGAEVGNQILNEFFKITKNNDKWDRSIIKDWLQETLDYREANELTGDRANEIFEKYVYLEEQSKFIANAVRCYEFFGCQWMMPFFDIRILDLWTRISNDLRFDDIAFKKAEKTMYKGYVKNIPFTGSKEIKHYHNNSGETIMQSTKRRLYEYFYPKKIHYLYCLVGLPSYYHNLIIDRDVNINSIVRRKYINRLEKK